MAKKVYTSGDDCERARRGCCEGEVQSPLSMESFIGSGTLAISLGSNAARRWRAAFLLALGRLQVATIPQGSPLNYRFVFVKARRYVALTTSRSGVHACARVNESPKPHTIDVLASLFLRSRRVT